MPADTSIYGQIRQPEPFANQLLALTGAERQQTALEADKLALGLRHLDAVHQAAAALAADPASTVDDAHRALGDLAAQGIITQGDAQRYAGQIEALRSNPEGFRSYLRGHVNSLQAAPDLFRATYGTPDVQDTGDNLLTRLISPSQGVRTIAATPKTLTPQDKANRIGTFQGGQPGTTTTSATTDRYGYPLKTPPIAGPQGGGGRAAGAMMPGGFVPTGPALGQTRVAEGGADAYVRDLQAAAGSSGEMANLQAALGNLNTLGPEGTGPGTQGRKRIASFLNAAGLGRLPGVDPKRIEDFDEAASYLASAARSGTLNPASGQAPGAGAPTTPDIGEISQPAASNLVRAQIGLKRLQQAQARSYQGQDNGAGYGKHAADFASEQDPRAYSFDLRTPAEKQKLLQSLGPKDGPAYRKFINSLRTAHDLGLTNAGQ